MTLFSHRVPTLAHQPWQKFIAFLFFFFIFFFLDLISPYCRDLLAFYCRYLNSINRCQMMLIQMLNGFFHISPIINNNFYIYFPRCINFITNIWEKWVRVNIASQIMNAFLKSQIIADYFRFLTLWYRKKNQLECNTWFGRTSKIEEDNINNCLLKIPNEQFCEVIVRLKCYIQASIVLRKLPK